MKLIRASRHVCAVMSLIASGSGAVPRFVGSPRRPATPFMSRKKLFFCSRRIDATARNASGARRIGGGMPADRTREELKKDEKEIGKNIPEGMKGLDTEDVGNPDEPV